MLFTTNALILFIFYSEEEDLTYNHCVLNRIIKVSIKSPRFNSLVHNLQPRPQSAARMQIVDNEALFWPCQIEFRILRSRNKCLIRSKWFFQAYGIFYWSFIDSTCLVHGYAFSSAPILASTNVDSSSSSSGITTHVPSGPNTCTANLRKAVASFLPNLVVFKMGIERVLSERLDLQV